MISKFDMIYIAWCNCINNYIQGNKLMAELQNVRIEEDNLGKFYSFSLSNKPEFVFYCDIESLEILKDKSFYVHISKKKNPKIYIRSNKNGKQLHFHREILGLGPFSPDCLADHIDRNTFNNRKYNLRKTDYYGNRINTADCDNSYRFGVQGLRANWVSTRKIFQIYFLKKYLGSARTFEKLQDKINHIKNSGILMEIENVSRL